MDWEFIKENQIVRFSRQARTHRYFSAFWFFMVGVLGMWLTPIIGAICTLIFLSLGWAIVWDTVAWIKPKHYHFCISRVIPVVVCVVIVLFYWDKYVALFPSNKQIEDKIEVVRDYSEVAKLDVTGLSSHDVYPLMATDSSLSAILKGCYIEKDDKYYLRCGEDFEKTYKNVIKINPRFPFSYYALAYCLKVRGDPMWENYAEKAVEILKKTTSISGHASCHDTILKELQDFLSMDKNKPTENNLKK